MEGTQGFGLSLLHGGEYPFVTSRDTTAAAFASEAGLSPRQIDEVVMVVRTLPIRVGGNSGPLPNEISWTTVQARSGAPAVEAEFTSVTNRVRRVAEFDLQMVRKAAAYNRPTALAVMGTDRLDIGNRGCNDVTKLSRSAKEFLSNLYTELLVPIRWVGTGFGTCDAIDIAAGDLTGLLDSIAS